LSFIVILSEAGQFACERACEVEGSLPSANAFIAAAEVIRDAFESTNQAASGELA